MQGVKECSLKTKHKEIPREHKIKREAVLVMINPGMILKLKGLKDKFVENHPKFPMFMKAVAAKGIKEGTVIEVTITDPEGTPLSTNIKVTESDMQLFETIKNLR